MIPLPSLIVKFNEGILLEKKKNERWESKVGLGWEHSLWRSCEASQERSYKVSRRTWLEGMSVQWRQIKDAAQGGIW